MKIPMPIIMLVIGVFVSGATWLVNQQIKANERQAIMQRDINLLMSDEERDDDQDQEILRLKSKFWPLHRWAKDEINEIQAASGKPLGKWPEIGD